MQRARLTTVIRVIGMIGMAVLSASASGCIGCLGSSSTSFPPGLEPLEDNTAPVIEGTVDDPYPEGVSIVTGTNDQYSWGHARGFIHATPAAVWDAMQDPEVVADRRQTDEQSWELDVEMGYDASYVIHYTVHDVVDVTWDETYRLGVVEGDAAAPELALARFQKTWGLNLIELVEGSLMIRRVDDDVTELELIRHLDAYMAGEGDLRPYLGDVYESVRARAQGKPLPVY